MIIEVKVPSVGESVTSGVVSAWHKKSGEFVNEGEPLFALETDKVSTDIVAEKSGVLETKVPEGQEVKIGEVVAVIDDSKQTAKQEKEEKPKKKQPEEKKKETESQKKPDSCRRKRRRWQARVNDSGHNTLARSPPDCGRREARTGKDHRDGSGRSVDESRCAEGGGKPRQSRTIRGSRGEGGGKE